MNGKQVKLLRGQIRQIVKELMPQVLHTEAVANMNKDLTSRTDARLDYLTNMVKSTLDQVDQRSKDMQNYVVRSVGIPTTPIQGETPVAIQGDTIAPNMG